MKTIIYSPLAEHGAPVCSRSNLRRTTCSGFEALFPFCIWSEHAEIISSFITPLRPKYPKTSFGFIKYQEQRGAAVDQWLRVKCPLSVRSRVRLQSPEGATLKGQSLCSSPAKMSEENRRRRSIRHENLCQIKSNVDYLLR